MAPAEKVQQTGVYIEAKSPKWGGGGIFDDFWAMGPQILLNFDNFGHFGGFPYPPWGGGLYC